MAPGKEMNDDTLLLLHIIHKDNPTLSGGNWPAISAKMGQPTERIRQVWKRFAAMRKEFLEMANDPSAEAPAARKRGRPPKNAGGEANGEAKPKAKRAKKAAAKPSADDTGDEVGSDADEAPAALAAGAKKVKKAKVKKEATGAEDAHEDEA